MCNLPVKAYALLGKKPPFKWRLEDFPKSQWGWPIINYGIKIQCPDCGSLFALNEWAEFFCPKCKRVFMEAEIRERCGL